MMSALATHQLFYAQESLDILQIEGQWVQRK